MEQFAVGGRFVARLMINARVHKCKKTPVTIEVKQSNLVFLARLILQCKARCYCGGMSVTLTPRCTGDSIFGALYVVDICTN